MDNPGDGRDVDLPEDDDAPVPVDSPDEPRRPVYATVLAGRASERRPIVPAWLRSRVERRQVARWAAGHVGHKALYHATRSPKYTARVAWRAPRGAGRLLLGAARWVLDEEGRPVRSDAVSRADAEAYLRLSAQRNDRVRLRGLVATVSAVPVLVGVVVAWLLAPAWALLLAAGLLVVVLGWVGSPRDKPLLDRAVIVPQVQRLTSDLVIHALVNLGLAGMSPALLAKNANLIGFPSPITRDGPGWRADVNLPAGVTATEVMDRREKLAANLTRPLGCVWPTCNTEVHPGRLILWVGDEDLSKARQQPWPLLKAGVVSLFDPFPFGTDARGRIVTVTLMFASMVVGSVPRIGKTFAVRLLLLAASLDVITEIHAYDLKGTGDFSVLEPVAYRYRAGDDEDDLEYAVEAMRELHAEMRRRTKVIRSLPRDICPESKTTPELARNRSLRLHPVVVAVDECQRWFENKTHGEELQQIAEDMVRRGPAVGINAIFATQRPDAKSLPTGISGNAVLRFALKVMGHMENDMVLGSSMHKNGIRATMFSRRDKGIGYLAGEGADPVITRSFYVDAAMAEQVVARARRLREEAGTLAGHAVNAEVKPERVHAYNLLDDLAAVWPAGQDKVWSETLIALLAELRPEVYGGWTTDQFAKAVGPYNLSTSQVWGTDAAGKGANRRGLDRRALQQAIAARQQAQITGSEPKDRGGRHGR